MQEKFFKDFEQMKACNATFIDYFHKMFEVIDNIQGNQRAILLYKLISDIREIGFEEGKRYQQEAILKFFGIRKKAIEDITD